MSRGQEAGGIVRVVARVIVPLTSSLEEMISIDEEELRVEPESTEDLESSREEEYEGSRT